MDFPVYVVLPAGGNGERFCATKPKQYQLLLNRPLLVYTLEAFHRHLWIKKIVMTVAPRHTEYVESVIKTYNFSKVTVTTGADTRHRSIYRGVKALESDCSSTDVVLIHDIVRLFADEKVLVDVAKAAKQYGAAGITRPLTSTVIARDTDGFLSESLDRTKYLASEMPQGFLYHVIRGAYEKATDYDFEFGTECLHLARTYMNSKVKLVDGPDSLWKVTYRKDIYAAEGILKESLMTLCISEDEDVLKDAIARKFSERNLKIKFSKATTVQQTASNFLFMHADSSHLGDFHSSINEILNDRRSESSTLSAMIDKVFVHVIKTDAKSNIYTEVVEVIQSCVHNFRDNSVVIYGVICPSGFDLERAAEMITTLIANRECSFNGQVLTVPRLWKGSEKEQPVTSATGNCVTSLIEK